ncbi:MAG: hypothetical protein LIR46_02995 [Bacteroidota bacterium]|nr:hypothetical protein [Bacteroidota bacterium]
MPNNNIFIDDKYTTAAGITKDILDAACYTITTGTTTGITGTTGTTGLLNDALSITINPQYPSCNYNYPNVEVSSYCSESWSCKKSSEKEEKKNMKPAKNEKKETKPAPKEIKIEIPDKDGNITIKTIIVPVPYQPRRIFFDPPATVVFWEDDTKTVVRCTEDDEFNPYYGFVCALGKKMFGTNNEITRMLKDAEWKYDKSPKNKEKKVETKPAPKPKKTQSNKNSKKEKPKK